MLKLFMREQGACQLLEYTGASSLIGEKLQVIPGSLPVSAIFLFPLLPLPHSSCGMAESVCFSYASASFSSLSDLFSRY